MSTQTSTTDLITAMISAQTYLYQIGGPILIVIGSIGCLLNLVVFTQKNLRKNPCTIYFIVYNLANFLYIYTSLLALTLEIGYNIDPSAYNLVVCHLRLYISVLFNFLSAFYLVLASIDRVLITSSNALTRQRSTLRLAYRCVLCGTLFWILFHIHVLILSNIMQTGPNAFLCYFEQGIYLVFMGYISIIKEILALSLLLLCGLWSIRNIRSIRRIRPAFDLSVSRTVAECGLQSNSSKDRQLMLMLFMDISIYASFSFMFAIFLMYQQITQDYIKSNERIQIETFIRNLCLLSIGIPFCTSCYTNLIASKTFRKDLNKILPFKRIFGIK